MPEALAAGGAVTCDALYTDPVDFAKVDKALATGHASADAVKAWLEAHPGQPVYRSTYANAIGSVLYGYVEVICVRE